MPLRRTRPELFRTLDDILHPEGRIPVERREELAGGLGADACRLEGGPQVPQDVFLLSIERLLVEAEGSRGLGHRETRLEVQAHEDAVGRGQLRKRPADDPEGPLGERLALGALDNGGPAVESDGPGRGADRDASRPIREPLAHRVKRVARLADARVALEDTAGLVEAEPVAEHQALEPERYRPQPARLGRRAPLAEALHLEVEVETVD